MTVVAIAVILGFALAGGATSAFLWTLVARLRSPRNRSAPQDKVDVEPALPVADTGPAHYPPDQSATPAGDTPLPIDAQFDDLKAAVAEIAKAQIHLLEKMDLQRENMPEEPDLRARIELMDSRVDTVIDAVGRLEEVVKDQAEKVAASGIDTDMQRRLETIDAKLVGLAPLVPTAQSAIVEAVTRCEQVMVASLEQHMSVRQDGRSGVEAQLNRIEQAIEVLAMPRADAETPEMSDMLCDRLQIVEDTAARIETALTGLVANAPSSDEQSLIASRGAAKGDDVLDLATRRRQTPKAFEIAGDDGPSSEPKPLTMPADDEERETLRHRVPKPRAGLVMVSRGGR